MDNLNAQAKKIKLVILDVDGVLTDGRLIYDNNGDEYKAFSSKDGLGIRLLQNAGIKAALLTGRKSDLVRHRAKNLDIDESLVYQGFHDKRIAYNEIKQTTGLQDNEIAYIGDDLIDLPVMSQVGLPIAVNDADPFVQKQAHWTTQTKGGRGAVREACELILEAQGKLQSIRESYLTQ